MTRDEMIECGRNVGAEYAVIRTPHDKRHPQVVFVLKGGNVTDAADECLDGESYVEIINMKDIK